METSTQAQTPTGFAIHDHASASEDARATLGTVKEKFGFVPNLIGVLAEAPQALDGYLQLGGLFEATSLGDAEKHILFLAVSRTNTCDYCSAAHTMIARASGIDAGIVDATKSGAALPEPRLDAFRKFVEEMVAQRGRPSKPTLDAFYTAGYSRRNALEVIVGIAMKTVSNYTNHLADTPIDGQFK